MRNSVISVVFLVSSAVAVRSVEIPSKVPVEPYTQMLPPLARVEDVKAILAESALPALPFSPTPEAIPQFPYSHDTLKHYSHDVSIEEILKEPDKHKFRMGVLHAYALMRKATLTQPKLTLLTRLDAGVTDKVKRSIQTTQDIVAVLAAELQEELDTLAALEELRQDQPQRWQAHYDYALAQLRRRLVIVHEYNRSLGDVRTESLPELPEGSPGWQLVGANTIRSRVDVKKLSQQADEGFKQIVTRYKGTPWEHLAARSLSARPGLAWEPIAK